MVVLEKQQFICASPTFKFHQYIIMALLVYSPQCKFCKEPLDFIRNNPVLQSIIRVHDIMAKGVPSTKITRVPSLVTDEGVLIVGRDIIKWMETLVPVTFEAYGHYSLDGANLDGSDPDGNFNSFGQSMQPRLTPELKTRISSEVKNATYAAPPVPDRIS